MVNRNYGWISKIHVVSIVGVIVERSEVVEES